MCTRITSFFIHIQYKIILKQETDIFFIYLFFRSHNEYLQIVYEHNIHTTHIHIHVIFKNIYIYTL